MATFSLNSKGEKDKQLSSRGKGMKHLAGEVFKLLG